MIILEVGINHFGKINDAKKFLNFFLNSQFTHLTFMIHTNKFYENFKKKIDFKLNNTFYQNALFLAHKKKKKIGLAVCDHKSFQELSSIKFDFYKLLSIGIDNRSLVKQLDNTKKEIFISLGKGTDKKIKDCICCFSKKKKLKLVYTSMSYNPEDLNLKRINHLKKKFNLSVGYGNHYHNNMAIMLSIAYGSEFIFLYIKDSLNYPKRVYPDHNHAIEISHLDELKNDIEDVKKIIKVYKNKNKMKIKINEIKKIKY